MGISIHKEKQGTLYAKTAEGDLGPWDPFPLWSDPFAVVSDLDADPPFNPRFDIVETADRLIIRADVPGVREQDLDVTLTDGQVVIKGKRDPEADEGIGTCYSAERASGGFTRTVLLPHVVEAEQMVVELHDGVLHLMLPRVR